TALLARRSLSLNDRIQVLSKPTLRQKLLTYLSECLNRSPGNSHTVAVPMNRAALASYLGVNRSALSRELSRMQKDGVLRVNRTLFFLPCGFCRFFAACSPLLCRFSPLCCNGNVFFIRFLL
ncbi:MAG: helix-turn-helix domain-containing protein, partial [Clostridia bacterium]|nr:helix-turn-helix domain-containing protein [Clostridia bacterium]